MQHSAFAERFLKHLDKIGSSEIENFVMRTVQERDFIARIFDALLAGVVVLDGELHVTLVNTAARRILHWSKNKRVEGECLPDILQAGPLRDLLMRFIENPVAIENEELVLKPGAERFYSVSLVPITEPENESSLDTVALILQDLTSSREQQLRAAQAEKMASLATLTTGVAHEIKNPLNSLSIHAQLLERAMKEYSEEEKEKFDPQTLDKVLKSCGVIHEEVERLRKCVDDFIDAARPRRPELVIDNINRMINRVLEIAALELEERDIGIETFLESDLPPVLIDENQVLSALRHLLRNAMEAIEAVRREPGEGRITVRTSLIDEKISLQISDNGCGIREEEISKVFDPYFTTKFNGSGLGLMAINRIVQEHGGEIRVNSTVDVGTTFTIELPIANRQVKLLEQE